VTFYIRRGVLFRNYVGNFSYQQGTIGQCTTGVNIHISFCFGTQPARVSVELARCMGCVMPEYISQSREIPIPVAVLSAAVCLLGSRVQMPLKAWKFFSCVSCVLYKYHPLRRADHSFRGILPRARVFVCVCVFDLEMSTITRLRPELGCGATEKNYGTVF